MSTLGLYFEEKPLRQGTKRFLGPADRYPQDKSQKEDELSAAFLKHGFSLINPLVSQQQESSSARDIFSHKFDDKRDDKPDDPNMMPNFYEKKLVDSLKKIQTDTHKYQTIGDDSRDGKRRVAIPKECFRFIQPGIASLQNRQRDLKIFLEDLSGSTPPLADMLNPKKRNCRVPMFAPRKSELFYLFAEYNIPVARAAWYIKLIAYNMPQLMPEQTSKTSRTAKRQISDPGGDWTKKVVDFFEEMWNKHTDPNLPTSKQQNIQGKPMTREAIEDYWNYANDILHYLYNENMLDKEEVLLRLIKICEAIKAGDEYKLRQILNIVLTYMPDVVRNVLHSRRVAFFAAQMIYWIEVEIPEEINREKNENKGERNNNSEYERRYDTLTWGLNSIIHLITMYCPSALVWYEPADSRNHPGSPLDILPQAPSQMLIPPSSAQFYNGEQEYTQYLRQAEKMLSERSTAVENKWSRYKSKDSLTSSMITRVVDIIKVLDEASPLIRSSEAKPDPLKPIYDSIFKSTGGSIENSTIIGTLCDWAVSSKRSGNFRSILVAKLLSQRQDEIEAQEPNRKPSVPTFQSELFQYLNESAPCSEKNEPFHHLICLFAELIRHEVFSHSLYISSLISRGVQTELSNASQGSASENRHRIFLEHLPIPISVLIQRDDEVDEHPGERNQREIALYGIGSRRKEIKKSYKRIMSELFKIMTEASEDNPLPSVDSLKMFRSCCYFQKWHIGSILVRKMSQLLRQNFDGKSDCKLPPKEGFSILINILLESGNYIAAIELATNSIPSLRSLESQIKRRSVSEGGNDKGISTEQKKISLYTRNIGLIFTGVLRLCHDYVLLESEICSRIFEGYRKLLANTEPLECFSAERVMLFYIYELYGCTKQKESNESGKALFAKIKIAHEKLTPSMSTNFKYSTEIYDDMLKIPFSDIFKIRRWCKKNIADGCEKAEENRFSIASAILIAVCSPNTPNARSNELAKLAADVTSIVPTLAQEWIGILQAIMPKTETVSKSYSDVLHRIDTGTSRAAEQMAVLYGILIARNVVKLCDVLQVVFTCLGRSLANSTGEYGRDPVRDKETRKLQKLCCEFLLFILRSNPPKDMLTHSADRHLLRACQSGLDFTCLAQALRILMVLSSDAMLSGVPIDQFKIFTLPVDQYRSVDNTSLLNTRVRDMPEFVSKILKAICSEGWVKEKTLRNGEQLVKSVLQLRSDQAHSILQLLCYPEGHQEDLELKDYDKYIEGILKNLDIWTLRQSRLQLLFLFKHSEGSQSSLTADRNLAATVAKLTTDIIQISPIGRHQKFQITGLAKDIPNVWLLANLIANLPEQVHLKVHSCTTLLLETLIKVGKDAHFSLQLPFLNLILVCIESHEKERKSLIDKLIEQMQHCVEYHKDSRMERDQKMEDERRLNNVQNIQLRLSLVGGMFKTVLQHSTHTCAQLLVALIVSGLADEELFPDIYFTCIDMLAVIIHHLAGGDIGILEPTDARNGSRRDKLTIEKKIRKEIGESDHPQILGLKQLIPVPREHFDVIKYEKAPVDPEKSWRIGSLKPVGKEKVNAWELIEGLKTPSPLSMSWFGASRAPRLPQQWQYRERMGEFPKRSAMEKWLELPDLPPDDVPEPTIKIEKQEFPNQQPLQQPGQHQAMRPPFHPQHPQHQQQQLIQMNNMNQMPNTIRNIQSQMNPMVNNQIMHGSMRQHPSGGQSRPAMQQHLQNKAIYGRTQHPMNQAHGARMHMMQSHNVARQTMYAARPFNGMPNMMPAASMGQQAYNPQMQNYGQTMNYMNQNRGNMNMINSQMPGNINQRRQMMATPQTMQMYQSQMGGMHMQNRMVPNQGMMQRQMMQSQMQGQMGSMSGQSQMGYNQVRQPTHDGAGNRTIPTSHPQQSNHQGGTFVPLGHPQGQGMMMQQNSQMNQNPQQMNQPPSGQGLYNSGY